MEFEGTVRLERLSAGSKSERRAVVLETDHQTFVLRRLGAHPFRDEVLDALVGCRIKGSGRLQGNLLLMTEYEVQPEPPTRSE